MTTTPQTSLSTGATQACVTGTFSPGWGILLQPSCAGDFIQKDWTRQRQLPVAARPRLRLRDLSASCPLGAVVIVSHCRQPATMVPHCRYRWMQVRCRLVATSMSFRCAFVVASLVSRDAAPQNQQATHYNESVSGPSPSLL